MGYVVGLDVADRLKVDTVGGKAANLGRLRRVGGIEVPDGFCVTSDAYVRVRAADPVIDQLLDRIASLRPEDRAQVGTQSAKLRRAIEELPIPDDVAAPITDALTRLGANAACAVRSSATAEDLPGASFAGQYDTHLNVTGPRAVLRHVGRCWASLFTERAVTYRLRNGIDHRSVQMAVIVQRMIEAQSSGVLFTADPVTSNRTVAAVEAVFGLGEELVSGTADADLYTVRDSTVLGRTIASKKAAIRRAPTGGTEKLDHEPDARDRPVLTDAQVVRLVQLGHTIEAHFGRPQDIEWCLARQDTGEECPSDNFFIVQSRPITTLFPIPDTADSDNHVYLSVGHQQMMTDPMKPLGLSLWQLTTPKEMAEAGGRLFVDVTEALASPASRAALLATVGRSDPLTGDAVQTVLARDDFIALRPDHAPPDPPVGDAQDPPGIDPAIVTELVEESEAFLAALSTDIPARTGPALFDALLVAFEEDKRILFDPRGLRVITAAMAATWWLNDNLQAWLGETNAADTLTLSAPGNVTSEMGLALLDVADVIRPYPDVLAYLRLVRDGEAGGEQLLDTLTQLRGGAEARDALEAFLDRYGVRCAGEIDITRPRWREQPAALLPVILGNIDNCAPGESRERFERGLRRARHKEQDLLARLRAQPDGAAKAAQTKTMIDDLRALIGYREYPKYAKVARSFTYRQALLREADRLTKMGTLRDAHDIDYLRFEELRTIVCRNVVDESVSHLIEQRKRAFASYQTLTPPRVLTSDGETINGAYRRGDLPVGALAGLAVSAGTVEGRARVVLDMAHADLEEGDILITRFTDPSWTPLFVTVAGLVTEIGGLMTHGAVIAREYGLPAVVGVPHATEQICDGQRIRVHGSDGYVEILPGGEGDQT